MLSLSDLKEDSTAVKPAKEVSAFACVGRGGKTENGKQGRDLLLDIKKTFSFFNNWVGNGGKLVKVIIRSIWKKSVKD